MSNRHSESSCPNINLSWSSHSRPGSRSDSAPRSHSDSGASRSKSSVASGSYFENLEQAALDLGHKGYHQQAIEHLKCALSSLTPRTLQQWTRYLSLQHSLGTVLASSEHYVDAAKVFAFIVLTGVGMGCSTTGYGVGTQKDVCEYSSPGIPRLVSRILLLYKDTGIWVSPNAAFACKNRLFTLTAGRLPLASTLQQQYQQQASDSATANEYVGNPIEIVVANALLNLAKLLQDGVNSGSPSRVLYLNGCAPTTVSILALYILSYSLSPSPSAANNIGILMASLISETSASEPAQSKHVSHGRHSSRRYISPSSDSEADRASDSDHSSSSNSSFDESWTEMPSSSTVRRLAYEYYQAGLYMDSKHPHLYTNLGSLLRQEGNIKEAIKAYEQAIKHDPHFFIALANLASCLKDQGCIDLAANYYYRAVQENKKFPEAVAGLANCFGTICQWTGRGSYGWESIAVDGKDNLCQGHINGWVSQVISVADEQILEARRWGVGVINFIAKLEDGRLFHEIQNLPPSMADGETNRPVPWAEWANQPDEGAKVMSLIEQSYRQKQWQWYQDRQNNDINLSKYMRPTIPAMLVTPLATTILPFHAFTLPFDVDQVQAISEKCATRISVATLSQPWISRHVFPPPKEPEKGVLKVGYVSSDFTNHPLAHLMQSVFGMHDKSKVLAYTYSTSPSDKSCYRQKIEEESHVFRDVSSWSTEQICDQIVTDGIHILVNLNGFTKGARNEIFAARTCPIQVSLMGFAGPMGADWIDYILGDKMAMPQDLPTPYKKEKIIYMPDTLFCCDHKQSAPDARNGVMHDWQQELDFRAQLRRNLFPTLPQDAFIMANFNQLYKIDPITFAVWLRILCRLPNSYLWLLQFPKSGQANLERFAYHWTGGRKDIVDRILFTAVADKDSHIIRSRVCDLMLDTPECNAHTTAVDVMWSSTPMIVYPRHSHKLCSRISSSIVNAGFSQDAVGRSMANRLIVGDENEYEKRVIEFGSSDTGRRELMNIRKTLFDTRFTSRLFDTQRYVKNLENAFAQAWLNWTENKHQDIVVVQPPDV